MGVVVRPVVTSLSSEEQDQRGQRVAVRPVVTYFSLEEQNQRGQGLAISANTAGTHQGYFFFTLINLNSLLGVKYYVSTLA